MYKMKRDDLIDLIAIKCRVVEGLLEAEELSLELIKEISTIGQDISQLISELEGTYSGDANA